MDTLSGQLFDYTNGHSSTDQFNQNGFYAADEPKSVKSDKSSSLNSDTSVVRITRKDMYCWICHRESRELFCNSCIRVYHHKCVPNNNATNLNTETFVCAECNAEEDNNTYSGGMSPLNGQLNQLADLLKCAMVKIKAADRNKTFHRAVSRKQYPDYLDFIVNPMDLSKIERNVRNRKYSSTHRFLADIKWIHHNCVIYNRHSGDAYIKQSQKLMSVATEECSEIETCRDCRKNYHKMDAETYFAEPCDKPHAIVWAKLAGHPYWPAKVVKYDSIRDQLDIRFFGTHDKCWLNPKHCYLMSKLYPSDSKPNKFDETKFNAAIKDFNIHLDRLESEYPGVFQFWPIKTVFEPKYLYLTDQPIDTELTKSHNNGVALKHLRVKVSPFDIDFEKFKMDLMTDEQDFGLNCIDKRSPSVSSTISSTVSSKDSDSSVKKNSLVNNNTNGQNEGSNDETEIDAQDINNTCENIDEEMSSESDTNSEDISILIDDESDSCVNTSNTFTVTGNSEQIINNISPKTKYYKNTTKLVNNKNGTTHCNNNNDKCVQVSLIDKHNLELSKRIKELEAERDIYLKQSELEREKYTNQLIDANKRLDETKRKQWCINCLNEAVLACCWNISYCTVECQHTHWPTHMKRCRRIQRTVQQQTTIETLF